MLIYRIRIIQCFLPTSYSIECGSCLDGVVQSFVSFSVHDFMCNKVGSQRDVFLSTFLSI